jgi:hypothetical protein
MYLFAMSGAVVCWFALQFFSTQALALQISITPRHTVEAARPLCGISSLIYSFFYFSGETTGGNRIQPRFQACITALKQHVAAACTKIERLG